MTYATPCAAAPGGRHPRLGASRREAALARCLWPGARQFEALSAAPMNH
ncbi:hypothetical protein CtCNB1_4699 [Comamonas thiooxydans]|nr:hypothetical protein CtCNB1_4699 [Comamonas thiooxydans]